jgi:uncharacterized protein VirK/YbjX
MDLKDPSLTHYAKERKFMETVCTKGRFFAWARLYQVKIQTIEQILSQWGVDYQ